MSYGKNLVHPSLQPQTRFIIASVAIAGNLTTQVSVLIKRVLGPSSCWP
jgi:hypothetical protein